MSGRIVITPEELRITSSLFYSKGSLASKQGSEDYLMTNKNNLPDFNIKVSDITEILYFIDSALSN